MELYFGGPDQFLKALLQSCTLVLTGGDSSAPEMSVRSTVAEGIVGVMVQQVMIHRFQVL